MVQKRIDEERREEEAAEEAAVAAAEAAAEAEAEAEAEAAVEAPLSDEEQKMAQRALFLCRQVERTRTPLARVPRAG